MKLEKKTIHTTVSLFGWSYNEALLYYYTTSGCQITKPEKAGLTLSAKRIQPILLLAGNRN